MSALDSIDSFLFSLSRAFCSPLAVFVQIQITSLYGGPLEFLFVVESIQEPAYRAVSLLISDFKDEVEAKIIVAGLSTTCSQKIHNQLNMHKDSKYVLFLDDDVRLHPGTIGALTAEMVNRPEIFIQTGYPLGLPSGSLGSYCIYEYHMPCSMGFATGGKTFFLWCGCMMMHADDFRYDRYGVVSGLRDGGYLDDMTFAAITGLFMVTCLAVCTIIELSSMWNLTRIEVKLCNMLSPEAPQLSLASYNWCLVFIAIPVDNFLYTISALRSHFSQSISWSGIPYHLKDGKISKIDRNKNIGPKFTDLGGKKLHEKKGSSTKSSFVGSLARSLVQWRQPKNIVYSMYSSPYMLSSYKEGMPLVASIAEGEIVWSTLLPLHSVQLNTPRD